MSENLPGIAFLEAEECCKWPVSGDGLDLRVCGGTVAKGKSYCAPHHMLAYVPWQEEDKRLEEEPKRPALSAFWTRIHTSGLCR